MSPYVPPADRCIGNVFDGLHYVRCSKRATRDGRCGIHHPDAEARRRAKSDARWQEQRAAIQRAQEKQELRAAIVSHVLASGAQSDLHHLGVLAAQLRALEKASDQPS